MTLLKIALGLSVFSTFSIVLVCIYLYRVTEYKFLKVWIHGWIVYLLGQICAFGILNGNSNLLFNNIRLVCALLFSLFFLKGIYDFLEKPIHRGWIYFMFCSIFFIIFSEFVALPSIVEIVITQLILGATTIYIGIIMTTIMPKGRFLNKLLGYTFMLWGIHKFTFIFLYKIQNLDSWGYLLNAVFQYVVAVEMVLLYFDMTNGKYELTKRKKAEEKIKHMIYHDNLTGLPNRVKFNDALSNLIKTSKVKGVGIIFIDVDGFKNINDSLGHKLGDKLIYNIAERLLTLKESYSDIVISRMGGDEFALAVNNVKNPNFIENISKDILRLFQRSILVGKHELFITVSIGISIYPLDGYNIETLIKNADIAMYRAKEAGKNNYQFFTQNLNTVVNDKFYLASGLRYAMERNELELYYQPKIDIETKRIVGMEALIRWNHPELGMVSPVRFIPLAEETGLINEIGLWVLKAACIQNKKWQDAGLPHLCVAVNLSPVQLMQKDIDKIVMEILQETGLLPKYLEIEITETIAMKNLEVVNYILDRLRKIGVQIALDDFGTGYSSLSYLRRINIDILKVDQAFIKDITLDNDNKAIISAIIKMAHSLNLKVTAEGVETQEQLEFLKEQDCDFVQGYYFSRPIPALIFESLITKYESKFI